MVGVTTRSEMDESSRPGQGKGGVTDTSHHILKQVRDLATEFAQARPTRQRRRELDPREFDRLRDAGLHLIGVPVEFGGLWESAARSTRPIAEMLRALAHGDSSVALVASMHPAVLLSALGLAQADAPQRYARDWAEQRRWVFQTVLDGAWWGTLISEPGSGGDSAKTRATARLECPPLAHRITGQKHFGSGSGITSYMITRAVPAGEAESDIFFMDMRGLPWDGSAGVTLTAPWDGHGMIATQSHAMEFRDFPATRVALPPPVRTDVTGGLVPCMWAAVTVGIVETAIAEARRQLKRRESLRPFEQVEWTRVELDGWLIEQAYEGMLRAVERTGRGLRAALMGKTAIAELAESALSRLSKVIGGGAYSRTAPFGFWYEDVRALGFLRPPWGLAFDQLAEMTWKDGP